MNRFATSLFLAVSLLLAACGGGPGASPEGGDDGGHDGGGNVEHPTGGDEAIFVIDSEGGFVPVEFAAVATPSFVLLGDGRVIVHGMQTLEFPGPALPPLMERTLTERGIQEVLALIGETNLFTSDLELDGAQDFVADAPDTVFTLDAAGSQVRVSVYGLGSFSTAPGEPGGAPELPPGMSAAEAQAHAALARLNDAMLSLDGWMPAEGWEDEGWQPYEPDALRLYVRDVTAEPRDGAGMPEQVREWPADGDPAEFGEEQPTFGNGTRCAVVTGDDADVWLDELSAATQLTLWTDGSGERRFSVLPRPLLPHEDATCPRVTGA